MINFKDTQNKTVDERTMVHIYNELKTPHKLGPVIKRDGYLVDSPTVFRYDDKWYMYYIRFIKTDASGYETFLAESDDLINWTDVGCIFKRNDENHWDSRQCAGYGAFPDINFGGTNELEKINNKYYMAYLGGNLDGYETDPLSMGLAYSDNAVDIKGFKRFEKPILSPLDDDVREHEKLTIYKGYLFRDEAMTTGYKYVNAYNAKPKNNHEVIYLAVSNDGENWERYGDKPVINDEQFRITGDPQIVKIDDVYVMLYFVFTGDTTYNTFACSYDLQHWTRWGGEPLIQPQLDYENVYAHKNYFIKHNGVVYHYYCAVDDKGERTIALAISHK